MDGPWGALPHVFAEEVRRENASIAAEIIHLIRVQIPEFGRPLSGQFGHGIRLGVEASLTDFADLISGKEMAHSPERMRVYRSLGRGELTEGRSLDALQAAYRLGARLAWRRYARIAKRTGVRPDHMVAIAEAAFAHIHEIAAESVRGYAEAKAREAGDRVFRRHRLLQLLVTGSAKAELEQAALAADWPLPATVACAALTGPVGASAAGGLPDAVLAELDRPDALLVIPEPRTTLDDPGVSGLLGQAHAVVGPTVPVDLAGDSLRWARGMRNRLPRDWQGPPVLLDDRVPELLILADPRLVRLIGERRLGVLDGLTVKQRRRLEETLLAWMQTNRSAPEVAARLGIHPQTARHRLHQIHALFGDVLADPDARFEIEVALRERSMVRVLLGETGPHSGGRRRALSQTVSGLARPS